MLGTAFNQFSQNQMLQRLLQQLQEQQMQQPQQGGALPGGMNPGQQAAFGPGGQFMGQNNPPFGPPNHTPTPPSPPAGNPAPPQGNPAPPSGGGGGAPPPQGQNSNPQNSPPPGPIDWEGYGLVGGTGHSWWMAEYLNQLVQNPNLNPGSTHVQQLINWWNGLAPQQQQQVTQLTSGGGMDMQQAINAAQQPDFFTQTQPNNWEQGGLVGGTGHSWWMNEYLTQTFGNDYQNPQAQELVNWWNGLSPEQQQRVRAQTDPGGAHVGNMQAAIEAARNPDFFANDPNNPPPGDQNQNDPNAGKGVLGGSDFSVSDSRGYEYDKGLQLLYAQELQKWIQGGKKGAKPVHYSQGGTPENNWLRGTTDPPDDDDDGKKNLNEQGGPVTGKSYMQDTKNVGGKYGGGGPMQIGPPASTGGSASLGIEMPPAGTSNKASLSIGMPPAGNTDWTDFGQKNHVAASYGANDSKTKPTKFKKKWELPGAPNSLG